MTSTDAEMVLHGRDGYLFLTNDTNRVLDQIQGLYPFSARQSFAIALAHATRRAFAGSRGIAYEHIIVPDRETVLAEFLPDTVKPEHQGLRPLLRYRQSGAEKLHAPLYEPDLLRSPTGDPFYFRRDTHWTFAGAWHYMAGMLPRCGVDPEAIRHVEFQRVAYENPGDLGSKIGAAPEPSTFSVPIAPWAKPIYDNMMANVGRMRFYANDEADNDERWLVLHDSFGEWLTLMLPGFARTTCFVHTPDLDELFMLDFRPTRIIFVQIERFFVRTSSNLFNYDNLYNSGDGTHDRLAEMEPSVLERAFPLGRLASI